ncbi:MAG: hypothetical protein DMD82_00710 [Candidatus Rokuibacteriota bacterium]|nr:MAG: hypothetical protein DMD82_00710 [Candidatus Rokubacteria bacterium]
MRVGNRSSTVTAVMACVRSFASAATGSTSRAAASGASRMTRRIERFLLGVIMSPDGGPCAASGRYGIAAMTGA